MTQCCISCCFLDHAGGKRCKKRGMGLTDAAAESPNRCHDFAPDPAGAFGGDEKWRGSRRPGKTQCDGQMSLFRDGGV